jgi:hypothetical protein
MGLDFDLAERLLGGSKSGGGGGKGDGCTPTTIKNPDGSSTEIKQYPARGMGRLRGFSRTWPA